MSTKPIHTLIAPPLEGLGRTRIAINGFGRIGRNLFRLLLNHQNIEVVAINDIADTRTMSHLIKYDSIHGVLPFNVSFDEKSIIVDGKPYLFFHEREISNLNWNNIDIVRSEERRVGKEC